MKKILIRLVTLGVFLILVLNSVVIAVDQVTEVDVTPDLSLIPTENPLVFGPLNPGGSDTEVITLTPGTSNLDVSVDVSDTGNGLFEDHLMFDFGAGPVDPEIGIIKIAAETPKVFGAILTIPVATPSGDFTGVITYTVMEDLPPA